MHPPFLLEGRGVEPPTKFSKSRGLRKREVTFFRTGGGGGGAVFTKKKKLKSEIFNGKKKFISKNNFLYHGQEFKLGNFN